MPIEIRRATIEDAAGIAAVSIQAWRETYPGIMPQSVLDDLSVEQRAANWQSWLSKPTQCFVAEDGSRMIGFVDGGAARDPGYDFTSEIYAIYLLQGWQKQGLGRRLVETFLGALEPAKPSSFYIWVAEGNKSARGFYERLGGRSFQEKVTETYQLKELAYGWPKGLPTDLQP